MKNKIFAFFSAAAILFSAAGVGLADTKNKKKVSPVNHLAASLPASDAIITLNSGRLFTQALPQILSANQPLLGEVLSKLDKVKAKTGIDLKQFDQVVIGVAAKPIAPRRFDFEPLILARGKITAASLLAVVKTASGSQVREEKIGDRTVYVFSVKEAVDQNKPRTNNSILAKIMDKVLKDLNGEFAVTSFDNNTLAIGTPARVRETFEAKPPAGNEVLNLINRRPAAVVGFAARTPGGLSDFLELDQDELGKNLSAIRFLYGMMDVNGTDTSVSLMARTLTPEQADGLKTTLSGFQMFLPGVLKSSKGADKKIYGKWLEGAKIARTGNEVTIDLQVPQSDINVLIGEKR